MDNHFLDKRNSSDRRSTDRRIENKSIEKTKQEKLEDSNKKSSGTNYHDIMSTTGDCTASCCASINSAQKVGDSKKKSNNQKSKKKFRWFSRSK